VLISGVATVDPVLRLIRTAARARAKMVDGELRTGVLLVHTAIATTKLEAPSVPRTEFLNIA
jgi:hypothetical protein